MYRTTEACEFKDDILSMPKIDSANSPLNAAHLKVCKVME